MSIKIEATAQAFLNNFATLPLQERFELLRLYEKNAELFPKLEVAGLKLEAYELMKFGKTEQQFYLKIMHQHITSIWFYGNKFVQQMNVFGYPNAMTPLTNVTRCYISRSLRKQDEMFEALSNLLPNVKELALPFNVRSLVITKFLQLEKLAVLDSDTTTINAIFNELKNLSTLKICNTKPSIAELQLIGISKLTNLRWLTVPAMIIFEHFDEVLSMKHLHQLLLLKVRSSSLSQEQWHSIMCRVIAANDQKINILQLSGYANMPIDWISKIEMEKCQNIIDLELTDVPLQMKQICLLNLARLGKLSLCNCLHLDDDMLYDILQQTTKLTELSLTQCSELTENVIYRIFVQRLQARISDPLLIHLEANNFTAADLLQKHVDLRFTHDSIVAMVDHENIDDDQPKDEVLFKFHFVN